MLRKMELKFLPVLNLSKPIFQLQPLSYFRPCIFFFRKWKTSQPICLKAQKLPHWKMSTDETACVDCQNIWKLSETSLTMSCSIVICYENHVEFCSLAVILFHDYKRQIVSTVNLFWCNSNKTCQVLTLKRVMKLKFISSI